MSSIHDRVQNVIESHRHSPEYRDYVRRLVDTFPPVTPEQKAEIGEALRSGVARQRVTADFRLAS